MTNWRSAPAVLHIVLSRLFITRPRPGVTSHEEHDAIECMRTNLLSVVFEVVRNVGRVIAPSAHDALPLQTGLATARRHSPDAMKFKASGIPVFDCVSIASGYTV
jgi:hypothetical protein